MSRRRSVGHTGMSSVFKMNREAELWERGQGHGRTNDSPEEGTQVGVENFDGESTDSGGGVCEDDVEFVCHL